MSTSAARDDARITGPADVARALTVVRERAGQRASTVDLRQPVAAATEAVIRESLPVHEHLTGLLPGGLPYGATVEIHGSHGARSLLIATVAQASAAGHWIAVVGMPDLNPAALAETGADLARVALVHQPMDRWADVIAALCDGLALVATAIPAGLPERQARALTARARRSGCVLVPFGGHWPAADLAMESGPRRWHHRPHGRLPRCWDFDVTVRGRGAASRPRRQPVHLPAGTAQQQCPLAAPPPLRLVTDQPTVTANGMQQPRRADLPQLADVASGIPSPVTLVGRTGVGHANR